MNIVNAILAEQDAPLPPIVALGCEYVVAASGLFVRAEDSRTEALIPMSPARLRGLADVEPFARLKLPRVPSAFLWSVLASARRRMPNEAMYQFAHDGERWRCAMPEQRATATTLVFDNDGLASSICIRTTPCPPFSPPAHGRLPTTTTRQA
ncbi:MAG: hypothetical protein HY260_04580 [Chloroflexi bacterium]|nr:hypothetical protein [Chloroflexota bacterium]